MRIYTQELTVCDPGVQVNATGVMPVIFSSTLLSLPTGLARSQPWLAPVAATLGPTGPLFLPVLPSQPPHASVHAPHACPAL